MRSMSIAKTLKRVVTAGATFGLLAGCGLGLFGNEFAAVLPGDEQVRINMVGGEASGQSLVDDESKRAGMYDITWGVTRGINGMVVGLLATTRWIVGMPPSERPDPDHAVWGPSDPKGLERLQFKATAERLAADEYLFVLLARPKSSEDEADYREIYNLRYFHAGPDLGHGTVTIDRDQHAEIDPQDVCETGAAVVVFSNDGSDEGEGVKVVDIDFTNLDRSACADGGEGQMGYYHYQEAEDGSGDFSFSAMGNIHEEAGKPGIETMTIRAQWTTDGDGRADVILEGDEIAADLLACGVPCEDASGKVVATQCWDENFISRYEETLPGLLREEIFGANNPDSNPDACPFEYADPTANIGS